MTKAELMNHIAQTHDITAVKAGAILETLADKAKEHLLGGEEFTLPGLGKLKAKTSAARTGRNPKTGATLDIPEKTVVKFTVAKALKDAVA